MRIGVIGNLTIDIVNGNRKPGGGAYYSGLVLSKFAKVTIYTKIGPEYPKEWIENIESFTKVVPFEGSSTTTFELLYSGDRREIKVVSKGDKFTYEELETVSEKEVIINPVANEIKPKNVYMFERPSLDIQGFVRQLDRVVTLKRIEGKFLENAFVVHASKEEYSMIKNPGTPEILAITDGSKEGVVITKGEKIKFIPKQIDVKDPTGAGDCFLALLAYSARRYNLQKAIEFTLDETAKFLKLGLEKYLEEQ
ncbi:hypothetical protein PFDSM3638_08020 [Pyrococcus furiosus DSM 3638]|uniref:Carbohydrate kinase PfkB domain-containing protein n=2 Tax=Pyrococcus furiosus TaxID=2261 RepID=A0A5C0XR45_PYRFU|nr:MULTISPECIES: PfkB family carbohydrate kinase [Pyrococcus]AFN04371.1 hypothetical protein PFC_07175 [Pyrococcus furiosus COM1]MDK2869697.1 hypothetical protein [Pyrococcus sp.]QEK79212.1 hypothetical protein PFDSM3638_08020 [Pyrococcus furiosus DSM 3638]